MSHGKHSMDNRSGTVDKKPRVHKIVVLGEGGVGKSGSYDNFYGANYSAEFANFLLRLQRNALTV